MDINNTKKRARPVTPMLTSRCMPKSGATKKIEAGGPGTNPKRPRTNHMLSKTAISSSDQNKNLNTNAIHPTLLTKSKAALQATNERSPPVAEKFKLPPGWSYDRKRSPRYQSPNKEKGFRSLREVQRYIEEGDSFTTARSRSRYRSRSRSAISRSRSSSSSSSSNNSIVTAYNASVARAKLVPAPIVLTAASSSTSTSTSTTSSSSSATTSSTTSSTVSPTNNRTKPIQEICWFEVIAQGEIESDGTKSTGTVVKWVKEMYEGLLVTKIFNKKPYIGLVKSCWGNLRTGEVLFRIEYKDGDREDVGWKEMEALAKTTTGRIDLGN